MASTPLHFIGEEITVRFEVAPVLSKSPTCPAAFTWREEEYAVHEMLETWVDYSRRGRMSHNMRPGHREMAARRGSWGVGRFYFRVRVADGRTFELYYDRAPASAGDRAGHWYLLGERREEPDA